MYPGGSDVYTHAAMVHQDAVKALRDSSFTLHMEDIGLVVGSLRVNGRHDAARSLPKPRRQHEILAIDVTEWPTSWSSDNSSVPPDEMVTSGLRAAKKRNEQTYRR